MSAANSSSDAVPAAIPAPAGILQGVKTIGLRGRILGLAIGLMALGAVCGAVALSGLLTEKTKVNQVSTSFKDFRAERDAYEGWLTADDQTNMYAALGVLGDRYGRKPVLVATLLMIGIGTTLIGVLPTFAQIGYWAPFLLVLMRVIQGLGAGAEYGGAVIYLVENAPPHRRGFWGSFAPLGVSIGNLLAAGAFALVTPLPREDLMSWGWRLPFLASFLLILVGLYVRMRVTETPVYTEAVVARGKVEQNPAMEALRRHPRNFFVVLGARLAENGLGYLFPVFGLSYVITTLGVPKSDALSALMLAFAVELFAIVGFASLSDRIGRRPVYLFGALCGVAFAFPFFWLVGTKSWILIALAFIIARAVVTAAMFGPQAAYFAELFPPQRRFAGFAFAREGFSSTAFPVTRAGMFPPELCWSIQSFSRERLKRHRFPSLNAGTNPSDAYLYKVSALIPR